MLGKERAVRWGIGHQAEDSRVLTGKEEGGFELQPLALTRALCCSLPQESYSAVCSGPMMLMHCIRVPGTLGHSVEVEILKSSFHFHEVLCRDQPFVHVIPACWEQEASHLGCVIWRVK